MATWRSVERIFRSVLRELEEPPIRLLRPSEFERETETPMGAFWGRADKEGMVITTRYRERALRDIRKTIYEETAHILFPSKPHWWIECFAYKLAGTKGKGRYMRRYGHSIEDIGSKAKLIRLARRATKRLKKEQE